MNKRLKNGLGVFGLVVFVLALLIFRMCRPIARGTELHIETDSTLEHATFAMGCFWHSEEIFLEINGVKEVLPGYCGGSEPKPSYEIVGSGSTRYAESVDVTFDPKEISYARLLEVFFREHDPTTRDRQGSDEGPQYRSVIFYHN